MSWDLKFPQAVARRRPFATLRDAGTYVTTFSKFHQNEARWQGAVHGLIQTADGGPIKVARLGVAQASHRAGPSMARSVRIRAAAPSQATIVLCDKMHDEDGRRIVQ